jgi:hypothetical protein
MKMVKQEEMKDNIMVWNSLESANYNPIGRKSK